MSREISLLYLSYSNFIFLNETQLTAQFVLRMNKEMKICFATGDSGSWTVRVRIRPTDELLVSAGLSADAGTVLTACSIL